ncbi:DNA repair protein RadC [Lysobacter lycopersici]
MDAAQAYPKAGNTPTVPVPRRIHAWRMLLHDWPAQERPRERLLAGGPAQLSDAELLAIFLGSGLRGQDAVATARDLLARHGPLRELLERGPTELMKLPGLGPARACRLSAALELCNRYLAAGLERGEALSDPHSAGRYFAQRLRGQPQEVFACLFLDARHRALAFEELFHGTVDGAEVHPREVVRRALAHNAAAVIAGHNHPSGNPEPSAADRAVTARLKQSLALVDVRLLDHFVIGDGAPSSMAARGWV